MMFHTSAMSAGVQDSLNLKKAICLVRVAMGEL
jgi:hypothetical protein